MKEMNDARVAQSGERDVANVEVAGSTPAARLQTDHLEMYPRRLLARYRAWRAYRASLWQFCESPWR